MPYWPEKPHEKNARVWCLTWNNYPQDWQATLSRWNQIKHIIAQPEVGADGTPHIQGTIWLLYPHALGTLKTQISKEPHFEQTRNVRAAAEYCQKKETQNGTTWFYKCENLVLPAKRRTSGKLPSPLEGMELYDWQQEIVDLIDTMPDRRTIHWFWEETGNSGKTALCQHLYRTTTGVLMASGKAQDVKYLIAQYKQEPIRTILWDIPRSYETYVSYQAMEEVKNGTFVANKYKTEIIDIPPPHVIVFANFPPELSKCSMDRWTVHQIQKNPRHSSSELYHTDHSHRAYQDQRNSIPSDAPKSSISAPTVSQSQPSSSTQQQTYGDPHHLEREEGWLRSLQGHTRSSHSSTPGTSVVRPSGLALPTSED